MEVSFASPWGLVALVSLPAIVAIHFFRRRLERRTVSALFLWPELETPSPSGRRWSQVEERLSLLLELLAAAALSLVLGGLKIEVTAESEHWVVVLDDSASMAARGSDGHIARDRAIESLSARVDAIRKKSALRLTILRSGTPPEVIAGPAADASESLRVLESWTPKLPGHPWDPSLELAQRIAQLGGKILILTDQPANVERPGAQTEIVNVGRPLSNLAFVGADRVFDSDSGGSRVFLEVQNFSADPRRALLNVSIDDKNLATQELSLASLEAKRLSLDIPPNVGEIHADLPTDALSIDNHVSLAEPRERQVRVRCLFSRKSPAYQRILRAVQAIPGTTVIKREEASSAHLEIGPAGKLTQPPVAKEAWQLGIGAPPETLRQGEPRGVVAGPYLADFAHPVFRGLDFQGVLWPGAHEIRADAEIRPLLTSGELVLAAELPEADQQAGFASRTAYLLNIDFERSNLYKSAAWPLLLSRLVEFRRDHLPGLRRWNFRQGETVAMRWKLAEAAPAAAALRLVRLPNQAGSPALQEIRALSPGDPVLVGEFFDPAIYAVLEGNSGKASLLAPVETFAVNFLDGKESDLRDLGIEAERQPAAQSVSAGVRSPREAPWVIPALVILVLAAAITNWLVVGAWRASLLASRFRRSSDRARQEPRPPALPP